MKSKRLVKSLRTAAAFFAAALLVFGSGLQADAADTAFAKEAVDKAIEWKFPRLSTGGTPDISPIVSSAGKGSAEWYAVLYSGVFEGADMTEYIDALTDNILSRKKIGISDRLRMSLAFSACGQDNEFIKETLQLSAESKGVIPAAYSLILLDGGGYDNTYLSRSLIIDKLLGYELSSGGFAISGKTGDVDVTAMVLQALSPYKSDDDVSPCFERSVEFLSSVQNDDGGFSSYGQRNCESSAQVLIALCAAGIDPITDSRFIKNGKTVVDAVLSYRLEDGSFSHGDELSPNDTATVQAAMALFSYYNRHDGRSIYRFTDKTVQRDAPLVSSDTVSAEQNSSSSAVYSQDSIPSDSNTSAQNASSPPDTETDASSAESIVSSSSTQSDGDVYSEVSQSDAQESNKNGGKTVLIIVSIALIAVSLATLAVVVVLYSKQAASGQNTDEEI